MVDILLYIILISIIVFVFIKLSSLRLFKFILDRPNKKRKFHKKPTPLIGGIIIFSSIILYNFVIEESIQLEFIILVSFFFILGFLDDIFNINAFLKLLGSLLILSIFINIFQLDQFYFYEIGVINLNNDFSIFFSILCILLFVNSSNMIDGIDGLSLSYFIILCIFLILNNQIGNNEFLIFLLVNLIIVIILNLNQKLFLGDSGIYLICIIFAELIISNHKIEMSNENVYNKFYAENIFLLMLYPGLDMLRLFMSRTLKGKSPFTPDRNHFHHMLLNKFNSKNALIIYSFLLVMPILTSSLININKLMLISFWIIVYISTILYLKKFNEN
tara:strand:- start:424 stop:1416 length:993 start_codon:yes stop_codon:yes gene_type:complete